MHGDMRSSYLAWALGSDHLYPEILVLPAGQTQTQYILGSMFILMIKPMSLPPPTDLPVSCLTHVLHSLVLCTLTCKPQLLARDAVFPLSSQFPSLHSLCLTVFGGGLVAKSCLTLVTPWTVACQSPLSMGFSRQENWNGLPFPSPRDLPDPGIKPGSPALQADSLPRVWLSLCVCVNIYFIYLFMAMLGLCCCTWSFSSCDAWDSHWGDFSCCRAQALWCAGFSSCSLWAGSCSSRALEHRLNTCGSRA